MPPAVDTPLAAATLPADPADLGADLLPEPPGGPAGAAGAEHDPGLTVIGVTGRTRLVAAVAALLTLAVVVAFAVRVG